MGQDISKQLLENEKVSILPVFTLSELMELKTIFHRQNVCQHRKYLIQRPLMEQIMNRWDHHQHLWKQLFQNLSQGDWMDFRLFIGALCAFTEGPLSRRFECCFVNLVCFTLFHMHIDDYDEFIALI